VGVTHLLDILVLWRHCLDLVSANSLIVYPAFNQRRKRRARGKPLFRRRLFFRHSPTKKFFFFRNQVDITNHAAIVHLSMPLCNFPTQTVTLAALSIPHSTRRFLLAEMIGLKSYATGREKFQGDHLDRVWFDE
jgi:hypothetical protein